MTTRQSKTSGPSTNLLAWILVAAYVMAILAIGLLVRPMDRWWLAGIGLAPALVALGAGAARVARIEPRGIAAVFHLIVYPLFAAIVIGLPAAYIAHRLARLLG